MRRILLVLTVGLASFALPATASAEETMKEIKIYGRPARPMVTIEITREKPNLGLRPLVPPKSFMGNQ